jgi:hypothetical protein
MKKVFFGIIITAMLAGWNLAANGKNNKAHLKFTGQNNAKINCVYCHTTNKIQKKKGADLNALYKTPACAGEKCHPVKKK